MMKPAGIIGGALILLLAGCDSPDFNPLEPPVINIPAAPAQKFAPTVVAWSNVGETDVIPSLVTIRDAEAIDRDGSIVKFFVYEPGGTKKEFTGSHFTYTTTLTAKGRYNFTVVAIDNDGLASVPQSLVVSVVDKVQPHDESGPVTFVRLKDGVSVFRTLPVNVCAENNGSFARDETPIRTIHWQTSVGDKSEGMSACFNIRSEGAFYIEAEAEDELGRRGEMKFLTVTVDTSTTRIDTVRVRDTTRARDTVTVVVRNRRPVAVGRIIGPSIRFVGEEVCAEEAGSYSPDGLRIASNHWIRKDGSVVAGMRTCYSPQEPGPLLFVYYVIDERGNVSIPLPLVVQVVKKVEEPPNPSCQPNPKKDLTGRIESKRGSPNVPPDIAYGIVANASALCSYQVLLASYPGKSNGITGKLLQVDRATIRPGQTLRLAVQHIDCGHWVILAFGDLLELPGPNRYGERTIAELFLKDAKEGCPSP